MGGTFCKPCCGDGQQEGPFGPRRRRVMNEYHQLGSEEAGGNVNSVSSSPSIPMPVSRAAKRAAHESKVKSMFESMRPPPSVEDEKLFMRHSLSEILEKQRSAPKECLLCMEGFNGEVAEVRTLCKCGENKYNYHLPCLLEWVERSGKQTCPVCQGELYFEENNLVVSGAESASQVPQSLNSRRTLTEGPD